MKKTLLILIASIIVAARLGVASEPVILFSDTFEDLSKWSPPTNQLDGVRMIHTTDEGSEALFGEAGNPYLRIYKENPAPDSINTALTGANILSEPSPVITIAFDFWNSPVGAGVVVLRPGKAGVANTARTHEIRFGRGQLAAVNNIYQADRTYRIEIVLNNSTDTVYYNDHYSVASDRFDVWLDGVRVLNDHVYGRPDPTVSTNMQVGENYTSMQWAIFTTNWGELRVDNLVVYQGAVVHPLSEEPSPVFMHHFDTLAPFGEGTNQLPNERVIEVTDVNSETYFGETGNPYLRLFKQDEADTISTYTSVSGVVASQVVTVSFDFWENSAIGPESGINFRAGTGSNVANANRVHDLALRKGAINGVPDLYQVDRRHNIQIVYNNSAAPVVYLGGSQTIAPDTIDVWIDGALILKDHTFNRGDLPLGSTIHAFHFVAFGANEGEFFIDNFAVYDMAFVGGASPDLPRPVVVDFGEEGGVFSISFTTASGLLYAVEQSEDLQTWQEVAVLTGDGEVQVASHPIAGAARRFYRVAVSNP
jgi:hypothetical protein